MELYENIKALREKLGMSQESLAQKTGYRDRSSIAKIEAGKVDLTQSKIAAFSNALHVSPAQLLGITDGEPTNLPSHSDFNEQEICIIEAYRKADPLDQALVRRVLHIDSSGQEAAASVG